MESLYKMQKLGANLVYLVHTLAYTHEAVVNDAQTKIQAYIDYRLKSEDKMKGILKAKGNMKREEVFDGMYGDRDLSDELYRILVNTNFDMQVAKLIVDGVFKQEENSLSWIGTQ